MNRKRQWLTDLRKEKRMTLRELAPLVNVSYTYLSDIETGRRDPSGKLAFRLAEIFGISMTRFFEGEQKTA